MITPPLTHKYSHMDAGGLNDKVTELRYRSVSTALEHHSATAPALHSANRKSWPKSLKMEVEGHQTRRQNPASFAPRDFHV